MKKNDYLWLSVLVSLIFIKTSYLAADEMSLHSLTDKSSSDKSSTDKSSTVQSSTEHPNLVKFDKKKYNDLVKKILRTKAPSSLSSAAHKAFKEVFYLGVSGLAGAVAGKNIKKLDHSPHNIFGSLDIEASSFFIAAVLMHTTMRLLFDYLLVSKDENLKNLENFEKYIQQTLSPENNLSEKDTTLLMNLFEKDYGLIANKLDQDHGAGTFRKIIRWLFKESIFCWESGIFGAEVGTYLFGDGSDMGKSFAAGSASGVAYYILLSVVFDVLLAKNDQRLLKIEKLRDIDQFFEEAKIKILELQHEQVASVAE